MGRSLRCLACLAIPRGLNAPHVPSKECHPCMLLFLRLLQGRTLQRQQEPLLFLVLPPATVCSPLSELQEVMRERSTCPGLLHVDGGPWRLGRCSLFLGRIHITAEWIQSGQGTSRDFSIKNTGVFMIFLKSSWIFLIKNLWPAVKSIHFRSRGRRCSQDKDDDVLLSEMTDGIGMTCKTLKWETVSICGNQCCPGFFPSAMSTLIFYFEAAFLLFKSYHLRL